MRRQGRALAPPLLVLIGLLLVQVGWILAVPPYSGIDEHDHAFRADAVAGGEWAPTYRQVDDGRGAVVRVRPGVIEAARPRCESLPYTSRDDCNPVTAVTDGRAGVGSAAARYNPVFYALVGIPALPFDGVAANYAMRSASALLCVMLVLLSWQIAARRLGPWSWLGALVVLVPTATYSMAIPGPNGVEMAAAFAVWSGGLLILRTWRRSQNAPGSVFALLITGAAILAVVRSPGPLWLALIAAVLLAALPLRTLVAGLRRQPRWAGATVAVAVAAVIAGSSWSLASGTNSPAHDAEPISGGPWQELGVQVVLWALQSVGAFPYRNEAAPTLTYAASGIVILALLIAGSRSATTRTRWLLAATTVLSVAIPIAATVATYGDLGFAWQGRYTWPLAMGVPILAASAISQATVPRIAVRRGVVLVSAGALMGLATAVGATRVRSFEAERLVAQAGEHWLTVPPALIATMVGVGFVVMSCGAVRSQAACGQSGVRSGQ